MRPSPLDRRRPPGSSAPRPFRFPEFSHQQLANGLELYVLPTRELPLLHLEMLLPAGGQYDVPGRPGLASLHSELIDEGSGRRTSLEIAAAIESLGGSLSPGLGWNMAYVEVGLLSQHLQEGLDLLAEVVRSPSFPEEEIERRRQQRLAELLRRKDLPTSLADQRFSEVVFGETVYGQPLIGHEESLQQFGRQDLTEFYRQHVHPNGARFIAVGDFDPESLVVDLEKTWGDWKEGSATSPTPIEPRPLPQTQIHLVDRPGSSQTQLHLGHASLPRSHPDFHRWILLNTLFGGKFTSRINLNLRERHGFTYGANSFVTRRHGPGPWTIRTAVGTEVVGAAVRELLFEMRRIRDEPVDEQELKDTQRYLVGVFPYTLQTMGGLLKRLEALAVFGLPDDFYEHYPSVFLDTTREELLETAQRHIQPDHLAIVAVGPAEELRPQLEELGPVTVTTPQ